MENNPHISHTDALKTILDDFPPNGFYSEEDIKRYILAFSFYLSAGDDAYRYHTNFLAQKHLNFRRFLGRARHKQVQLDKLVKSLIGDKRIEQWQLNHQTQAKKVRISMDDFCQRNLSGDVSLCDKPSIAGAEWGRNIVTVHFGERTASFFYPVSEEEQERAVEIFLSLVTG